MNNPSNSISEYIGKDETIWKAEPYKTERIKRHNIVNGSIHKVVLPPGKIIYDPVDSFNLFFDSTILKLIVKHTNFEAMKVLQNKWKLIDIIELQAFLGLLLTTGVDKQNKVDFREYWDRLFVDDKDTKTYRKSKDKHADIRELWENINQKLQKLYLPGENLTIDEQFIPFRGRVSFKQYLRSKPIVNKLCQLYYRTNRNVTFDNYFTSLEVTDSLFQKELTIVSTMKKNKRCIFKNFLPNQTRDIESNVFGFCKNMTLVLYVPRKNRAVFLLSTMQYTSEVNTKNKNKSEIIFYYNAAKKRIDTLNQMIHKYTVRRRTNRWTVAFFQNIIDVVGIASFIIWKNLYPT